MPLMSLRQAYSRRSEMRPLPRRASCPQPRLPRGMSLIEVLVATLVVSVGILGLASLMSTATRLGKTSELRSVASLLAADLADRLRANASAADAGNYQLKPTVLASSRPASPASLCITLCEAAQIAALDLAQWQATLFNSLPSGTGYLSYDPEADSADLWVVWRDPAALDADQASVLSEAELGQSCPPNFSRTPRPVCMYFRVAR